MLRLPSWEDLESTRFAHINSKRFQLLLRMHHAHVCVQQHSQNPISSLDLFTHPYYFNNVQQKPETSILISTSISMSLSILETLGPSSTSPHHHHHLPKNTITITPKRAHQQKNNTNTKIKTNTNMYILNSTYLFCSNYLSIDPLLFHKLSSSLITLLSSADRTCCDTFREGDMQAITTFAEDVLISSKGTTCFSMH